MKLVNQRTDWDCGYAVLAIFAGISYEKAMEAVLKRCPDAKGGPIGDRDLMIALRDFGYDPIQCCGSMGMVGVPEILIVASLNFPGVLHYIVLDGNEVLDPQTNREGKKFFKTGDNFSAAGAIVCKKTFPEGRNPVVNAIGSWIPDFRA